MTTEAPHRIVSLNLCADQLLIALADPPQIAGLSRNARDPALSAAALAARHFPIVHGGVEQMLLIAPDMLVGMPATGSDALALLAGKSSLARSI